MDKEKITRLYQKASRDKKRYKKLLRFFKHRNDKNISKYIKICLAKKRFKRILKLLTITDYKTASDQLKEGEKILSNFVIDDQPWIFYVTNRGLIGGVGKKHLKNSLSYELYLKTRFNPCCEIRNYSCCYDKPPVFESESSLYKGISCTDFATLVPLFNLPDLSQEEIQEIIYHM